MGGREAWRYNWKTTTLPPSWPSALVWHPDLVFELEKLQFTHLQSWNRKTYINSNWHSTHLSLNCCWQISSHAFNWYTLDTWVDIWYSAHSDPPSVKVYTYLKMILNFHPSWDSFVKVKHILQIVSLEPLPGQFLFFHFPILELTLCCHHEVDSADMDLFTIENNSEWSNNQQSG